MTLTEMGVRRHYVASLHQPCGRTDQDPTAVFHTLVHRTFHGNLKPPFNEEKRAEAGVPPNLYWPPAGTVAAR